MQKEILDKIKMLKDRYQGEGLNIIGVFGSSARGQRTEKSDIDILYEIDETFYRTHPGWAALAAIDEIQAAIEKELNCKVDFANKNALNEIGKKYILPEVLYV